MSILHELYGGNIAPGMSAFKKDSEYESTLNTIVEKEKDLLARLTDEEKDLFIRFRDAQVRLNCLIAEENFIKGFKLGALIMLEVADG